MVVTVNKTIAKEMLIKDKLSSLLNKRLEKHVRETLETSESYIVNGNKTSEIVDLLNKDIIPTELLKVTKKGDKIIKGKSVLSAIILADKEVEVEIEELN